LKKNNFLINLIHTFGIQFSLLILNVIQSVLINRSLIPQDKGTFALIMQSLNIIVAFGQFGQPEVMFHYITKNKKNIKKYISNLLVIIMLTSLFSFFIINLYYKKLDYMSELTDNQIGFFIIFMIIPFSLINIFYQRIIQLNGDLPNYNRIVLFQKFSLVSAIMILIFIMEDKISAIFYGHSISLMISSLITIVLLINSGNLFSKPNFDLRFLKKSLFDGFKIQIGLVSTIIGTQLGVFILASQIDNHNAGIYSVSLGLVNMFLIIPNSIRIVFQAWFAENKNAINDHINATAKLFRYTLIFILIICLPMYLFGEDIIFLLYGESYVPSYTPMTILLFYLIFRTLGSCFGSYFAIEKKFWFSTIAVTVALSVNIISSLYLSKLYGINGIALSSVLCWFIWFIICCREYLKISESDIKIIIPTIEDVKILINSIQYKKNKS